MSDATITRGPAATVGTSSIYSAGVAYLTLLIAARTLSPADNATFLVYWALLFGAYGVVTGVSPEAARASYAPAPRSRRASVLGIALVYGAMIAAVIGGTSPLWATRVLHGHAALVAVVALACFSYTGHLAIWGVVTGQGRWNAVAGLVFAESTVRLVLVALVLALFADSLDWLALAAALPALTWIVALVLPVYRQAARRHSDSTAASLLRHYSLASLASAASALLMVGFPVLISATSTPDELAVSAGLLLGISLTRAPLLVPLSALQGVALAHFLRHQSSGRRALWSTVGPVLGITVAGAVLAYAIGAWLFRLLLGGSYALDGATLSALTVSAGLLATLTLTGMYALALHRHALFAAGWVAATASAILLLLAPLPLTERVLLSLLAGPLIGVLVHVVALGRSVSRDRAAPTASND